MQTVKQTYNDPQNRDERQENNLVHKQRQTHEHQMQRTMMSGKAGQRINTIYKNE